MPTPHIQRRPGPQAVKPTWSSPTGPPSPGPILGSFIALIDNLLTAQTELITSYLRIGSSVARRPGPATPTASTLQAQRQPDQAASERARRDPASAPARDAVEARAYQIFLQRGREPGNPVDDWHRAEAELRAEMTG